LTEEKLAKPSLEFAPTILRLTLTYLFTVSNSGLLFRRVAEFDFPGLSVSLSAEKHIFFL